MIATPEFCTNHFEHFKLTEGLSCHLSCPTNFRTSFDITETTCFSNGTWSKLPQHCLRKTQHYSKMINVILKSGLIV